jgi:hypothetical protein
MLLFIFPGIGHPSLISSAPKEWADNKSSTSMLPAIPTALRVAFANIKNTT